MKKHTFKVGDKVRVREWEDMVEEYREKYDDDGYIPMPGNYFGKAEDGHLCGKEVVVKEVDSDDTVKVEGHVYWLPTAALEPIEEEIKEGDWVLVKSWDELVEKFGMDTYTKARLALKKEPIKSFIKHGILDENEQLTNQGREVFIEWLLSKHQDEFYKEVVQKMEDKKK